MPVIGDLFEEKPRQKEPREKQPRQSPLNIPQRHNNPGNLRDPNTGAFRTFHSPDKGWRALRDDLTAKVTGNTATGLTPTSTLRELAAVYAPTSDKNKPDEWAKQVADHLKVTPDTQIGKLSDKVDRFAVAVAHAEGWFAGRKGPAQTAPVPKARPRIGDLFGTPQPAQDQSTAAPPAGRPKIGDLFGTPQTEKPKAQQPEAPREKHSWYSTGMFEALSGQSASEHYENWLKEVNKNIPESLRSNRIVQFGEELSKMGPGALDFITSPAGAGIAILNVVPQTRVLAAGIDMGLGLQQGAQLIFSAPHILADPSPKNLAEATAAAMGMVMGVKGGRKHWAKEAPKFRAAPLEERMKIREAAEAAAPEDKAKVLASFSPPGTERIKKAIYKYQLIRDVASVLEVPKPKLLQVAQDIVREKTSFLNGQMWRINDLAFWGRRDVPAADLKVERMGDVIQGNADPAILSESGRKFLAESRAFERENVEMMQKAYGKEIPLQDAEHYLTQIFDMKDLGRQIAERKGLPKPMSEEQVAKHISRYVMKDKYLMKKKIPDYKYAREVGVDIDGENYKLKPLYDNVIDIMKARHEFAAKAIANQGMANTMRKMGALLSDDEANKLGLSHWPVAPEATALYRATYSGKMPSGESVYRMKPPRVHPDWEMPVNGSFGQPYHSAPLAVAEAYRAAGKSMALKFSIFHHGALSEQAHAIHLFRSNPFKTLGQTWFLNKNYWRGARSGLYQLVGKESRDVPPVYRMKPGEVKGWLEDGMQLSAPDSEAAIVKQLQTLGKDVGPVGRTIMAPARWAGKLAHTSDVPLWDYYHPGSMLTSAETILAEEMKRLGPNATPMQIKAARRAIADHVNNAYGAINMENLMLSPRARTAMNFLLLAPAWTTSNIRILTQGFESETGARLTGKWVAGAALSWFVTTELMNYALSGWFGNKDKDGIQRAHWTWDNPGVPLTIFGKRIAGLTDHSLDVVMGYNKGEGPGAGTERYLKLGKGFREVFAWLTDFVQTFGGKMSLPARGAAVILTGHEPGSGFQVIDMQKDSGTTKLLKRIEYATGLTLPFGLRDEQRALEHKFLPEVFPESGVSSGFAGLPTVRGMSVSKAAAAYGLAIEDGNSSVAQEILRAAALNHLNVDAVIRAWRTEQSRKARQIRPPRRPTYDTHGNVIAPTAPPPG